MQKFLVVLVADFPVENAVVCKQSDVGGRDHIRKVVDSKQGTPEEVLKLYLGVHQTGLESVGDECAPFRTTC